MSGAMPEITLDPARRSRTRARLGVGDETCLFAYVGALGVANGLDTLIDAAKAVRATAGLHIVLAGDGSDRARVAKRLADEHVPNITLLEPLAKDEVIELVEAADVCLHLLRPDSLFEGALPTKVLEYFGARRPVITTTEGLPARIVTEAGGEHCRDASALAEALERWASMSPSDLGERGERSHAYGARHFGFDATADALESHLQRVVEGERR